MATNAQHQAAWRSRRQINLTDTADEIAAKLMTLADEHWDDCRGEMPGEEKLRKIGALIARHFKDNPCDRCKGTGMYQRMKQDRCHVKRQCTYKSPAMPCPVCCPVEYAEASGVTLRKEGHYAEAAVAAMKVWDDWALAETLVQWGAEPQEIKAALRQLNSSITIQDINALRKSAEAFPPNRRDLTSRAHARQRKPQDDAKMREEPHETTHPPMTIISVTELSAFCRRAKPKSGMVKT